LTASWFLLLLAHISPIVPSCAGVLGSVNMSLVDGPLRMALMLVPQRRLRVWLRQLSKTMAWFMILRSLRSAALRVGLHNGCVQASPPPTKKTHTHTHTHTHAHTRTHTCTHITTTAATVATTAKKQKKCRRGFILAPLHTTNAASSRLPQHGPSNSLRHDTVSALGPI